MEGYTKWVLILALALVLAAARDGAHAQMCGMTQDGFNACKPAVRMNDPPPPCKECCDAVEGADLKCLCSFANSPILRSLKINKKAALSLPVNCNVDPNFRCQNS